MTDGGMLCVFAHPDDEQYGTAGALLACIERGIRVDLLCATRGEGGEISDPALATPATLATVREGELRTACDMLGIQPPRLLGYPDGGLARVDRNELVEKIVATILELRPRAVLTFDANGGYGHPDHIAIHHATVAAIERAGAAGHRIDKLYATAYPRSHLGLMNQGLAGLGLPGLNFGAVQTIGNDELGASDERITTAVPVATNTHHSAIAATPRAPRMSSSSASDEVATPPMRSGIGLRPARAMRSAARPKPR